MKAAIKREQNGTCSNYAERKQARCKMKKEYMKPAMRVVKMQQRHIICTSPGGYNGQSMQIYSSDAIDDENAVW